MLRFVDILRIRKKTSSLVIPGIEFTTAGKKYSFSSFYGGFPEDMVATAIALHRRALQEAGMAVEEEGPEGGGGGASRAQSPVAAAASVAAAAAAAAAASVGAAAAATRPTAVPRGRARTAEHCTSPPRGGGGAGDPSSAAAAGIAFSAPCVRAHTRRAPTPVWW